VARAAHVRLAAVLGGVRLVGLVGMQLLIQPVRPVVVMLGHCLSHVWVSI
jgi:hypothetical protein